MPIAQPLQCFGYATHATSVQLALLYLCYEGGTIETEQPVYHISKIRNICNNIRKFQTALLLKNTIYGKFSYKY